MMDIPEDLALLFGHDGRDLYKPVCPLTALPLSAFLPTVFPLDSLSSDCLPSDCLISDCPPP